MAIQWGAEVGFGSGNGTRLGIEMWHVGDPAAGSVTLWSRYVIWTRFAISDGQTLNRVGEFTGAYAFSNNGGEFEITRNSKSVSTVYGSAVQKYAGAYISGHFAGVSPTVDAYYTIPARPYNAPANADSITATWDGATADLSWDPNSSTGAPVDEYRIERWNSSTNTWSYVGSFASNVTSVSNQPLVGNGARNQWRIRQDGPGGSSGWVVSNYLNSIPSIPTSVAATKNGANIDVTWASTALDVADHRIWHAANGVWDANPIATVSAAARSWTHVSPTPGQQHKYRVTTRAHETGQGYVESAYSSETSELQMTGFRVGSTVVSKVYVGATLVPKAYLGSTLFWNT